MKKKNRALIAGVVVLALLLVFYLVLHNRNKDSESEEQEETQAAYETDLDKILGVTVSSNGQEYHFSKQDEAWKYDGDNTFPLDTEAFDAIVAKFENIAASRIIEETDDTAEFGLDSPSAVVKLEKTSDSTDTLTFGDTNSVTDSSYMTVNEDTDKIYMVDSTIVASLQFSINDLAQIEEFPSITSTTITGLTANKEGQEMSIKKDDSSSTGWSYTGWDGGKKDADSSAVSEYMSQISGLSWNEYVSSNQETLGEYGLDNPTTITIDYQVTEDTEESTDTETKTVTVDKQEILLVGTTADTGDYYAKLQSQSGIYTVSGSTIDSILETEGSQFMNSYVSNYIFADLDTVVVEKDGKTYTFSKKTEEKEVEDSSEDNNEEEDSDNSNSENITTETVTTYYMNDKEIELTDFSGFYSNVTSMECQEWLNEIPDTQNKPEMTIHFWKQDGLDVITEYYSYDSNFYLVKDSKGNGSFVNKMKVKEMMDAFDSFIEKVNG